MNTNYKKHIIIDWVIYERIQDEYQEIAKKLYQPVAAQWQSWLWEVDPKWYTVA